MNKDANVGLNTDSEFAYYEQLICAQENHEIDLEVDELEEAYTEHGDIIRNSHVRITQEDMDYGSNT